MKTLELTLLKHSVKIGDVCDHLAPNIQEDTLFTENGKPIGFFIKKIDGRLKQLIHIANTEFLSDRVPKSVMNRSSAVKGMLKTEWEGAGDVADVSQLSTIIGAVKPNPFVRRNYPSISQVHREKSANNFIKAMIMAAKESELLIQKYLPEVYEFQKQAIIENVPEKYRFANLFTSSISNYNISAPYHRDTGNIKGCVNVIITKKKGATGGNLSVPDYGAVMDSSDDSILVYPAWKNVHGVTPIVPTFKDGYRNSLVFYPLAAFKKFM